MAERTYVIAEIGSNHGGLLARMTRAIRDCAGAGASAVKFQWASDGKKVAERRGKAAEDGYGELYAKLWQWPVNWHEALAEECKRCRVDYMCTVYLPEDVVVVAPHVARFKVASFEAMDFDFLVAHTRPNHGYDKPLIVSTGMLEATDVRRLHDAVIGGQQLDLLHCISAYPAPVDQLNLAVLRSGYYVGFSDHSSPAITVTGALAVAAGARVIEAHVRVEGQDPDLPDYPFAMSDIQFRSYVHLIRTAEGALGEGNERHVQECERDMTAYRVV